MKESALFRKQAINYQKSKFLGDVLLIQPISHFILCSVAILVIVLLCYFLVVGEYSRKAKVQGYLVPDKGIINVYAQRTGVVIQVHTKKGTAIKNGDAIFTLQVQLGLEQGGDIDTNLLEEIARQKTGVNQRLTQEQVNFDSQIEHIKQQISSNESTKQQLNEQLILQNERVQLASKRYESLESLFKQGHMAEVQLEEQEELLLTHKQELLSIKQRIVDIGNTQNELNYQLQQAPANFASLKTQLESELSTLVQREVEIQGRRTHIIYSPIDGVISSLHIKQGQTTQVGLPLLTLH